MRRRKSSSVGPAPYYTHKKQCVEKETLTANLANNEPAGAQALKSFVLVADPILSFLVTLMAKDKKKHSKKGIQSDDLLDEAAIALKKFRKVTKQINKLSTGQKLVGGVALLAAGLTYLAKKQAESGPATDASPDAKAAEETLAKMTDEKEAPMPPPRKIPHRSKKSKHILD